ncbi:MAG: leucine-rich repeat protein [Clostridia bacterium]|nr:leucine-rich repeat protein [Clostridia bacterium]
MRKKIFSVILSALMVLQLIPVFSSADVTQEDNFLFWVNDNKAHISGVADNTVAGELVIPETLGGFPVYGIDWLAFEGCKNITSVVIPSGVASIGESAFSDCTSLQSVVIPESVTSIGYNAFYGCKELSAIMISDGAEYIGEHAFEGTAYYNNEENWIGGVLYIGNYLIKANSDISGHFSVPITTAGIACSAFSGCENLVGIAISGDVGTIEYRTFYGCTNLESVILPDGLEKIEYEAFSGCGALERVYLPQSVKTVDDAFNGCEMLKSVYFAGTRNDMANIETGDYGNEFFKSTEWYCNYSPMYTKAGDINGDGEINNKDLTKLFQYLSGWEVDVNEIALDINGDGGCNNKDLTRFFQYLSDWSVDIYSSDEYSEIVVDFEFQNNITVNGAASTFLNPSTGFMWPVAGYYGISSPFGSRGSGFHSGMDISGGGISGRPILAIADGEVYMANNSWTAAQGKSGYASYGNFCAINHGTMTINGSSAKYVAFYAHATSIIVSVGQRVKQGQVIGYVGTTGDSAGPHLHIGIQKDGSWVNPCPLLRG